MENRYRVLIVGCGHMGASHARAYKRLGNCEIVGLVSRGPETREALSVELGGAPTFASFDASLAETRPDIVCISTYPDTHARYATLAMEHGAHVFLEKPLATTVPEAEAVVQTARRTDRKLVIGYILRHHPAWTRFTEYARNLGRPLVMRMNLNQQSSGDEWRVHRNLMESMSPIVDCGVHYVDIMCRMTGSKPIRVYSVGARLTDEIDPSMYNYGHLQVTFADGSVGWYEAGWGPMMSETAFFVKDVIGPAGSVSLVAQQNESSDIEGHTRADVLRLHHGGLDADGRFRREDEITHPEEDPGHDGLCELEQRFLLDSIEKDVDLTSHLAEAVDSLRIVLAADESVRTGQVVDLDRSLAPAAR
jgi:predicted dehydrogenase